MNAHSHSVLDNINFSQTICHIRHDISINKHADKLRYSVYDAGNIKVTRDFFHFTPARQSETYTSWGGWRSPRSEGDTFIVLTDGVINRGSLEGLFGSVALPTSVKRTRVSAAVRRLNRTGVKMPGSSANKTYTSTEDVLRLLYSLDGRTLNLVQLLLLSFHAEHYENFRRSLFLVSRINLYLQVTLEFTLKFKLVERNVIRLYFMMCQPLQYSINYDIGCVIILYGVCKDYTGLL